MSTTPTNPVPNEPFYMLLHASLHTYQEGDEWLAGDYRWVPVPASYFGNVVKIGEPPARRPITPTPSNNGWIKYSDRMPTEEDASKRGYVINHAIGSVDTYHDKWHEVPALPNQTVWKPLAPPIPEPAKNISEQLMGREGYLEWTLRSIFKHIGLIEEQLRLSDAIVKCDALDTTKKLLATCRRSISDVMPELTIPEPVDPDAEAWKVFQKMHPGWSKEGNIWKGFNLGYKAHAAKQKGGAQ